MQPGDTERDLPLFPLQAVLFPGGLLRLKVFEARYLDLVASCLREREPFGVVALRSGREVGKRGNSSSDAVSFETVGTVAELITADSVQPGILQVSCKGTARFKVLSSMQRRDGLWVARVTSIEDDQKIVPTPALIRTVKGLANMIATLKHQDESPFLQPYQLDDASWVANRWCEILPIPQAAKQKLMELPDPIIRLQLVDEFLSSKGVVN